MVADVGRPGLAGFAAQALTGAADRPPSRYHAAMVRYPSRREFLQWSSAAGLVPTFVWDAWPQDPQPPRSPGGAVDPALLPEATSRPAKIEPTHLRSAPMEVSINIEEPLGEVAIAIDTSDGLTTWPALLSFGVAGGSIVHANLFARDPPRSVFCPIGEQKLHVGCSGYRRCQETVDVRHGETTPITVLLTN